MKLLLPISANSANSSSPDSTPMPSISSDVITVTGRAPVIFAPLICDPVTTISSTSEALSVSWEKAYVVITNGNIKNNFLNMFNPLKF